MGRTDEELDVLIADGGLATTLADAGHDVSGALWSARVLSEDPRAVMDAHAAFVAAGARVLTTASYQATVDGLVRAGVPPSHAARVVAGSVALARAGGEAHGVDVRVAASSGTWSALRGPGADYRPMPPEVTVDRLATFHLERARILAGADPDVLLFETLPGVREVRAAVEVAEALGHPAWITVTTPDGARTVDGEPLADVAAVATTSPRVSGVGINCSAPGVVEAALRALGDLGERQRIAKPNAGSRWDGRRWRRGDEASTTDAPRRWRAAGATVVGGCCGTSPDDVRRIADRLAGPG